MIDTGDIVFFEHSCLDSFTIPQVAYCYSNKINKKINTIFNKNSNNWDSTGVVVRDNVGARVLFYYFNELFDLEYDETLRIPFFKEIGMRKFYSKEFSTKFVSSKFRSAVREVLDEKIHKTLLRTKENNVVIPLELWKELNICLDSEKTLAENEGVDSIDKNNPTGVDKNKAVYSACILLRTAMSKEDTKNF